MSKRSSPHAHTKAFETSTVPPKNSIPSSELAITSTLLIIVPFPTPPKVNPLISLSAPITAPPSLIDT